MNRSPDPVRSAPFLRAAVWLGCLALAACTPMSETEREYLEKRREEREAEANFQDNLTHNAKINELLKKVKEWKQEDGRTAEQFMRIEMDKAKGQVLAPAWTVNQTKRGVFHVTCRFMMLDEDYNRVRVGFRWMVDEQLDRITGPETLRPEEMASRTERETRTQQLRRRDPWSLE